MARKKKPKEIIQIRYSGETNKWNVELVIKNKAHHINAYNTLEDAVNNRLSDYNNYKARA